MLVASLSCQTDGAGSYRFSAETRFQHEVCLENAQTISELPEGIWKELIWSFYWHSN